MPLKDAKASQDKQLLDCISEKARRRKRFPADGQVGRVCGSKALSELQVTIYLLLVELCEKFTFLGVVCNMILFCTIKLGYHNYQAAMINLCFVGACMVTPVLMSWLAECLVGRIKLVYICTLLHFIGTALLPVVAFPFEDIYIEKHDFLHTLAKSEQEVFFGVGLCATCLGSGGIRAIVCPLSAYSLDDHGQKELLSFFNWFYWMANLSSAIAFVSISCIQQSVAKNLGLLIPSVSVLMALITIHMARSEMIGQPPKGSSLLTVCGVFANALKECCVKCRYFSGNVTNLLDHAKENYGGRYSETEVESTKWLLGLFPLFAFQILYRTCVMQIPSAYYLQTMNSNLNLNGFLLPMAAMNVMSILPFLILTPVLDCLNNYFSNNAKTSGWCPTVFIVVGYTSATLSVMVAGFFEVHRKHFPLVEQTLSGKVLLVSSMPCIHLSPQYILLGAAEALVTPTCSLITFKFVPGRLRGIAMQVLTFFNGVGCIVGAFLVQAAYVGSQGDWFPSIPSEGKLERFYFFLASLMVINTLGFWTISHRYNNLQQDCDKGFRGDLLQEQLLQHEKSLKFYDSTLDRPSPLSPMETLL
ncbi:solute carrier family 15 member 5 [Hemicordylus capensis]|uniref:solute carrier family 15 member 5 n=1 Tax=Hemicordylus capensis TaxID=884348 RepID=UPI002303EB1B|nr:solute carrier family 15 member 5 [Hemicordylus capensis]